MADSRAASSPSSRLSSAAAVAGGAAFRVVAVVLSLVVAVGAVVQSYRIGHSGAEATWSGEFSGTGGGGEE